MNRPEFTREQEDWICYQLGDWYLDWKDHMVAKGQTHCLGIATESLKRILCDHPKGKKENHKGIVGHSSSCRN